MEAPVTDLRVFRDSFVGTLRGAEFRLNVFMAVLSLERIVAPPLVSNRATFSFQVDLGDAESDGAGHAETISPLDAK